MTTSTTSVRGEKKTYTEKMKELLLRLRGTRVDVVTVDVRFSFLPPPLFMTDRSFVCRGSYTERKGNKDKMRRRGVSNKGVHSIRV